MSDFGFLKQYVLDSPEDPKRDESSKHLLFKLDQSDVDDIRDYIEIPYEQEQFWNQIGYGFFHRSDAGINRFLDPFSFKIINLKLEYYEFDPTLEIFEDDQFKDKFIFYEVVEGNYLLIDKKEKNGKNAIYFWDEMIAESLEEFVHKFDRDEHYFFEDE